MSALAEMTKAPGQFGTGLAQHARLIALVSSQESGLPESLMAEQFVGREAVNELFRFDVDALSTAASLDLASFLGEELTIKLLQPDGSHRAWHGLCTDSAFIGADGGVIDAFRARRQVQANAVGISSWDPQQLVAPCAEQSSSLDAGDLPPLALYDGTGERRHADSAAADPHSLRMLQALELNNKQFDGAGAVRRMAAGHAFNLLQHEHYAAGANHFTTLWVEHRARNNLGLAGSALAAVLSTLSDPACMAGMVAGEIEAGTYRNTFDSVAIVPRAPTAARWGRKRRWWSASPTPSPRLDATIKCASSSPGNAAPPPTPAAPRTIPTPRAKRV